MQALLAAVDSIGREAAQREGACRDLQQRIEGLQDDRIEMLAQMAAMAPRSELDNAKEEVSWLRGELAGLRGEAAAAQEERERLISMLQVIALPAASHHSACRPRSVLDFPPNILAEMI